VATFGLLLVVFGVGLALRRHPRVSALALALLVVGGGLYYYFTPPALPKPASTAATSSAGLTSVQGSLPSPQAPVEYFKAQETGDANGMWLLLSDNLRQGSTVQQLQQQLQQMQPRMGAIKQITYVGGAKELEGNAVYLYLLTVERSGQTAQVTYLFTLDPQGKILRIE